MPKRILVKEISQISHVFTINSFVNVHKRVSPPFTRQRCPRTIFFSIFLLFMPFSASLLMKTYTEPPHYCAVNTDRLRANNLFST